MEEEKKRQDAIYLHLIGKSIAEICHSLLVSRKWFYKWLSRYKSGDPQWYVDRSTAPKHIANKTSQDTEKLVLEIRNNLESTPFAQIGARTIAWHIEKLAIEVPPLWTINRILKRNARIKAHEKSTKNKSNIYYPYFIEAFYPGHIHQADLWGPRYIKNDGRFYCFSTIDRFSHQAHGVPIRAKNDLSLIDALMNTWQTIGIPEFLQLDNELSFHGSNRFPHSLGKVLKLCLSVGIQPVFIPVREPWRNGVIEHFNRTVEKSFFRTECFNSFNHFQERLKLFLRFHNDNYVYSANHGKTPKEILEKQGMELKKLSGDFIFSENDFLPYESYIHFIRFIRSDLKLRIWSESFNLPKEAMYQYVRATIFTEFHLLNVFLENTIIAQFNYRLPNFNQEDPEEVLKYLYCYFCKCKKQPGSN